MLLTIRFWCSANNAWMCSSHAPRAEDVIDDAEPLTAAQSHSAHSPGNPPLEVL